VLRRLPLFPLGTVLYPGLVLPLHIFEERYRLLVQSLVELPEDADRSFGVVAIREGREVGADGVRALHAVGCTAELRQVEAYADGRFDIVTVGATRFRLESLDASRPYLQADVEELPEQDGDAATLLAASVARRFTVYRDALIAAQSGGPVDDGSAEAEDDELGEIGEDDGDAAEDIELPEDPAVLSYLVAAAMVLDLADKQRLLAAGDASARLRAELGLLRRESAVLQRLPSLPATDLARQPVSPN